MVQYSLRSTGALISVVVVVSISLFGLLLILLDASALRQRSEQARVRAEERYQARLAARLELQQEESGNAERSDGAEPDSAAEADGASAQPEPATHAAVLAVVTCPGETPRKEEEGGAGRELLLEAYRDARAGNCPSLSELGQSGGRRRPAGSASFQSTLQRLR